MAQSAGKSGSRFVRRQGLTLVNVMLPGRGMVFCLLGAILLTGCGVSLHDTVARGDLERAKAMIARNPEVVHSRGYLDKTALHYAVMYKRIDAMALLLEHGADINAADYTGMTPLHVAALAGRRDEARWLIAHGADIEARDRFGDMPVHTAAVFGQGGVVKLLLDHGAALDAVNNEGKTPLDLAWKNRRERAAKYIEELHASRTVR